MAWNAPMTAVDGDILTANKYNLNVRDNFLETAPAKARNGGHFASTGPNSIYRYTSGHDTEAPEFSSASATYTDWTGGPTFQVVTSYDALVVWSANVSNDTAGQISYLGFRVFGATTLAADDTRSLMMTCTASGASNARRLMMYYYFEGGDGQVLNPGLNWFQLQVKTSSGTGRWSNGSLLVIPT